MSRITVILSVVTAIVALFGGLQWLVGEWRAWQWRRKQTGKWLVLVGLCCLPSIADAACTGSGLAWTCPAGETAGNIQTAINNASNEAVITFAAGSYTFSGVELSGRNGISLVCATVGGCTNSSTSTIFTITGCTADITNLMRISGWNFTGATGFKIWIYCTAGNDITKLRLDHLDVGSMNSGGQIALILGTGDESGDDFGNVYGVIDHVNCHGSVNYVCMKYTNGGQTWTTGTIGTANALYFEDNICNITTEDDFSTGCTDGFHAHAVVYRFNTVTNAVLRTHGLCHWGPQAREDYGNVITTADGFWELHHQGSGEYLVWGNQLTSGSDAISLQHYRSDASQLPQGDIGGPEECSVAEVADGDQTGVGSPGDPNDGNRTPLASYYGYPAWHQPGRDGAATLKPVYAWKNTYRVGGANVPVAFNSGTWTGLAADCANTDAGRSNCHFQLNRDIYQYTTSFDGTSGTGAGTLANRPATCTPTPESADAGNGGVGYWCTDCGTWKSAVPDEGVDVDEGVLYRCSATNTWTVAYTPYTYPHPLRGETTMSTTSPLFHSWWWLEALSLLGAAWHWRGAVAGVLIFLLGCGVTGASMITQATTRTYHVLATGTTKVVHTAAKAYLSWSSKDTG